MSNLDQPEGTVDGGSGLFLRIRKSTIAKVSKDHGDKMKINRKGYPCLLVIVLIFLSAGMSHAKARRTGPTLNNGKKWRIGYYEGGPYSEYKDTMRTLLNGLMELGWIESVKLPELTGEVGKPYMDWLTGAAGPFLSIEAEDCYSAAWDTGKRRGIRKRMLDKLKAGSLDLVIAMGTWAGLDLATGEHSVPVLVLSTSDPVGAGIIKSPENSGRDHVTARIDPKRYLRQLRMFHRIVGFKSLGIAYENTPDGLLYSSIRVARQIARERGFELILCEVTDTITDTRKSDQSCIDCYRKLSRTADAAYVTALTCVDRQLPAMVDIFRAARVPSFSLVGSRLVKKGILLSISSDSGYIALGRYNAAKFGAILNGVKPVELEQVFEDPPDIAVNTETARRIDLLITDVIMPEMNGRELADTLSAAYPNLKCLFMSGYTDNVIAHHGVLEEGVHFIQKPFSENAPSLKIRKALDEAA